MCTNWISFEKRCTNLRMMILNYGLRLSLFNLLYDSWNQYFYLLIFLVFREVVFPYFGRIEVHLNKNVLRRLRRHSATHSVVNKSMNRRSYIKNRSKICRAEALSVTRIIEWSSGCRCFCWLVCREKKSKRRKSITYMDVGVDKMQWSYMRKLEGEAWQSRKKMRPKCMADERSSRL